MRSIASAVHNSSSDDESDRRTSTRNPQFVSSDVARRRRTPPRNRNSTADRATIGVARSSHPNSAFFTPTGVQRTRVRGILLSNQYDLVSFLAQPELAVANSRSNNDNTNSGNNNDITNHDITLTNNKSNVGNRWLGSLGFSRSLARPLRSINNNQNDDDHQTLNIDRAANVNNTTRSSTPFQRRRIMIGFRHCSDGALAFDGRNNNNNDSSNNNELQPVGRAKPTDVSHAKTKPQEVHKHHILQITRRLQQQNSKRYPNPDVLAIVEFWRTVCPSEVTLKMLAFLGPQIISQLQKTQRIIKHLFHSEVSWRVLCEELYKWRPGEVEPDSWKEHYRINPCVPVDFSSIGLAMAVAGTGWTTKQYKQYVKSGSNPTQCPEIKNDVTIWLRANETHKMKHAINVHTLRRSTKVTIRTMHTTELPAVPKSGNTSVVGKARARDQQEECYPDSDGFESNAEDGRVDESERSLGSGYGYPYEEYAVGEDAVSKRRTRALLKSWSTRRHNEPLIRVLRGKLILQEVELEHSCLGTDIWNGNAAIQIQPSYLHGTGSILALFSIPYATAVIQESAVQSLSGRGIVVVDSGCLVCERSYVHHCAATGVYLGGRGSCASLSNSDICYNGNGNHHLPTGVASGHSGIYVEQSEKIELNHCSVAYNTASGISMISLEHLDMDGHDNDNNITRSNGLFMNDTHVLANGSTPIDLPQTAFEFGEMPNLQQRFLWQLPEQNNRVSMLGVPQARSIPLLEELRRAENRKTKERTRTQSLQQQPHRLNATSVTGGSWTF